MRRTGFARLPASVSVRDPDRVRATPMPTAAFRAPMLVAALSAPIPKTPRAENAHLLRMAKGKPCLIRSPICNYDPETTVACHGGGVENGKGMAYKVSDALTCWGCSACNHYTDAYAGATRAQKREAFELGHLAQVDEWRAIASLASSAPADRRAAQWALDHLNATPVGQETP